jgi:hypothetical protein
MKHAVLVVALAACGDKSQQQRFDSGLVSDGPALACSPTPGSKILMRLIATTRGAALLATAPPNDARVFIVEQQGRIRILTNDQLLDAPFLDISDTIACCGEQGLLGLAFHPKYQTNGTFFVFYTTADANVVARYHVSSDPDRAEPQGRSCSRSPTSRRTTTAA